MIEDYDKRHAEAIKAFGKADVDGNEGVGAAPEAVSPAQYALSQSHKHLPEMKMMSGLEKDPVFCPVVGDFYRGMVMTVELPSDILTDSRFSAMKMSGHDDHDVLGRIKKIYRERYSDEPLIRITEAPENGFLYSDSMAMSDRLEIMVLGNIDRILLVSRFDNLGKGASGAAVQNLNIMLGINETTGLRI